MKLGIIGGSGLYEMEGVHIRALQKVSTPYGSPSSEYRLGSWQEHDVVFLPRHGAPHAIPPHRVNYRANLFGFRELGTDQILSISATGGLDPALGSGSLVLLDQVVDMTSGRESSFFDGPDVHHVDFTEPYCPGMREVIESAAARTRVALHPRGTYLCTNGPRLESAAEVRLFAAWGAHVVGMTGMPEAGLARELELCYAAIAVVTNPAAGLTGRKLTTTEVVETMAASQAQLTRLLSETLPRLLSRTRSCTCNASLRDSSL